jgi:hypothetical protein
VRGWEWAALALQILAFAEMIYWTSPSLLGARAEFTRLLNYKLAFTGLSLALLLLSWRFGLLRPEPRDSTAAV